MVWPEKEDYYLQRHGRGRHGRVPGRKEGFAKKTSDKKFKLTEPSWYYIIILDFTYLKKIQIMSIYVEKNAV